MGCNKILSQEEVVDLVAKFGGSVKVTRSHTAALEEIKRLRNSVKYRRDIRDDLQGKIDARDEDIVELKNAISRYQHLENVLRDSIYEEADLREVVGDLKCKVSLVESQRDDAVSRLTQKEEAVQRLTRDKVSLVQRLKEAYKTERAADPVTDTLPTEFELMEDLRKKCRYIETVRGLHAEIDAHENTLRIRIYEDRGNVVLSPWFPFRPGIEPPAKNTVVFVRYEPKQGEGFYVFPVVSLGKISDLGRVAFRYGPTGRGTAQDWYDPKTGNHSVGWDIAWFEGVE